MSYSVAYNPELRERYPEIESKQRKLPVKPIVLAAAVVVAFYIIAASGLLRYCIPGEPGVTAAAFSEMVTEIEEGESVRDAFIDFCKEIIYGGS